MKCNTCMYAREFIFLYNENSCIYELIITSIYFCNTYLSQCIYYDKDYCEIIGFSGGS